MIGGLAAASAGFGTWTKLQQRVVKAVTGAAELFRA